MVSNTLPKNYVASVTWLHYGWRAIACVENHVCLRGMGLRLEQVWKNLWFFTGWRVLI